MPKYIDDVHDEEDEYDWSVRTWETLSRQPGETEDLSEDAQEDEDDNPGAVWKAVEFLEMVAPHIRWRIKIDGDDTFGGQWDCVIVPIEQLNEAEWIMQRYLEGDDLTKYSPDDLRNFSAVDQFPEIYVFRKGTKALHPGIQRFYDLCENLGEIIEGPRNEQLSLTISRESKEVVKKLEALLEILPQIYSLGLQLPYIYRSDDIWDLGYDFHGYGYDYQDCLGLGDDNKFIYINPPFVRGKIEEGCLSEIVASIYFDFFKVAVTDFQSDNLHKVAKAVNFWHSQFKHSDQFINAAFLLLAVLPVLNPVLCKIKKRNST